MGPEGESQPRRVGDDEEGLRVDVLIARWLDESRAQAQERLRAGEVLIGQTPPLKSRRVVAGEMVTIVAQPSQPPVAVAMQPVPVRYEDEHVVVVAKPAGLVVHRGAGTKGQPTLVDALRAMDVPLAHTGDGDRPGIVHRLDRGTSGVLVIAKTDPARTGLVAAFKRHAVDRQYWALVDGNPDPPAATIDAPIARSASNRTRFAVNPQGRRAVTHYDLEESFGRASVMSVRLETGRTHQVRVHLSAVGHPVTGDRAYGASTTLRDQLGLHRPALHANRLGFVHPVTGTPVVVDEPLPDDLLEAVAILRS